MTERDRTYIAQMRNEGKGYAVIADALGVSRNTVKSYCQRNKLGGAASAGRNNEDCCRNCGKLLIRIPGCKPRQFCDDSCRQKFWNSHRWLVSTKNMEEQTCGFCKRPFKAYAKSGRKYCCHECYIRDRFGGDGND